MTTPIKRLGLLTTAVGLLFLFTDCSKADIQAGSDLSQEHEIEITNTRNPAPKIDICHYSSGNNAWKILNINENAWSGHEGHGDVRLDDQDNDGFVPNNSCNYGTMGDCDDHNFDVNPNAVEICNNFIDDNCDGDIDENDLDCAQGELELIVNTGSETYTLYAHPTNNASSVQWGDPTVNIVGLTDITSRVDANTDFDGMTNTAAIVAQLGNWNNGNYAAKICDDLVTATSSDWYLPSIGELKAIGDHIQANGGDYGDLLYKYTWSSTEYGYYTSSIPSLSGESAWYFYYHPQNLNPGSYLKQISWPCRCVHR